MLHCTTIKSNMATVIAGSERKRVSYDVLHRSSTVDILYADNRKKRRFKLNVWDFMRQSALLQAEMMQTFLLCFDTANFVFGAWIYGKTKPVLLFKGVWNLISIPSSTVNNKQNCDLREVSVESFLPVSPASPAFEYGVRLRTWKWENERFKSDVRSILQTKIHSFLCGFEYTKHQWIYIELRKLNSSTGLARNLWVFAMISSGF